ncbi:MAG: gamma carbonic anhydrase family protein [Hyphomicrobiales bacterium]|nr:gamma carbonic anhydrase family protein [Hyphomicrobiales bacterium]
MTDVSIAAAAGITGDVTLGDGCRVAPGAQLNAGAGRIVLGRHVIVMENAVLRATPGHDLVMGDHCLVGPLAHVVGARVADRVFIATGAAVFHGSVLERGCEVRIHGVVHIRTRLPAGAVVPIGWVAVGDPAAILPPGAHDAIWARQEPLDFPGTVYGVDRAGPDPMAEITRGLSARIRY